MLAAGAAVLFQVSSGPEIAAVRVIVTTPRGADAVEVARLDATRVGDTWEAALAADTLVPRRPGRYAWRAEYAGPSGQGSTEPESFKVTPSAKARRRGAIPRRFGRRRNGRSLRVSVVGLPPGVSRTRLKTIARSAARRWGLAVAPGFTTLRPGRLDGVNVLGFASRVPRGALGVTRVASGGSLYDADVSIRRNVRWFAGAGYPDLTSYDLQTVVIHELGHFAGNPRHARRCSGSPLTIGGAAGEWWRSPGDWFEWLCDRGGPPLVPPAS